MSSKYSAKKTEVDGIVFDSKLEAGRYSQLKLMLSIDQITKLALQPTFPLVVNGDLICTYIADFIYIRDGKKVVEDAKGMRTRDFRIKWKLFQALYRDRIDCFELWPPVTRKKRKASKKKN